MLYNRLLKRRTLYHEPRAWTQASAFTNSLPEAASLLLSPPLA